MSNGAEHLVGGGGGPHSTVPKGSWSPLVGYGKKGPQKRKRRAQGVGWALLRGEVNGGGGWVSQ